MQWPARADVGQVHRAVEVDVFDGEPLLEIVGSGAPDDRRQQRRISVGERSVRLPEQDARRRRDDHPGRRGSLRVPEGECESERCNFDEWRRAQRRGRDQAARAVVDPRVDRGLLFDEPVVSQHSDVGAPVPIQIAGSEVADPETVGKDSVITLGSAAAAASR